MEMNPLDQQIKDIKQQFSLLWTAERLELEVRTADSTQAIRCVSGEHEDRSPSLVLMPDVNRFECKSCNWKGDVIDLVRKVKKCGMSEAIMFFLNDGDAPSYHNPDTYLADRGLKQETIKKFNLTLEKPDAQGMPTVVAIPVLKKEGKTFHKFRVINPAPDSNKYWGETGYSQQLFKTFVNTKSDYVILTEGEFDAMMIWQETKYVAWTNVTGKATDMEKFKPDFVGMNRIYIAYDTDKAGEDGAARVAEDLGRERCFRVRVPTGMGKDWTDYFLHGGTKEQFIELLRNADSYKEKTFLELYREQRAGKEFIVETGVSFIDDITGGLRSSNSYLLGGLEKSGKSSLLLNFLISMLRKGQHTVGYINTEFNRSDFAVRMAALHNHLPKAEIENHGNFYTEKWIEQFQDKILYAGIEEDTLKIDGVLNFKKTMVKLEELVRKGMTVLFFDNITTYATSNSKKANWEVLSQCITDLVTFSKARNITIIMVVHQKANTVMVESEKIKKLIAEGRPQDIFQSDFIHIRKPTISDLFGGGTALSQVSGTILVWRPFQKFFDPDLNRETQIILESFRHSEGGAQRVYFNGAIGSFETPFESIKNKEDMWKTSSVVARQQEEEVQDDGE